MKRTSSLLVLLLIADAGCAHKQILSNAFVSDTTAVPSVLMTDIPRAPHPPTPSDSLWTTKAPKPVPPITKVTESRKGSRFQPTPIVLPKPTQADLLTARKRMKPWTPTRFEAPLIFDIPVAYNGRVKYWIEYFQGPGRPWFTRWLERSPRYLPLIQKTLRTHGLPQDLAYMAMIESGFSPTASSAAQAVGPWQFIRDTAQRFGLKVNWWLDERRDFQKSTEAAAQYIKDLYGMFHNWYLVAASYNTGEGRIKRAVERHGTKNFWKIARTDLDSETKDYVPKLMAALLISKAPGLYGFHLAHKERPLQFERFWVPGGTRLDDLALAIGVPTKDMEELNPELIRGLVPSMVSGHFIRIPKGSAQLVGLYIRHTFAMN